MKHSDWAECKGRRGIQEDTPAAYMRKSSLRRPILRDEKGVIAP
jgi:hypothetical protein